MRNYNASIRKCKDGLFRILVARDFGFADPVSKGFITHAEVLQEANDRGFIVPNTYWDSTKERQ